nr:MAG: putative nonstructural protein [Locarnavirus sp.]
MERQLLEELNAPQLFSRLRRVKRKYVHPCRVRGYIPPIFNWDILYPIVYSHAIHSTCKEISTHDCTCDFCIPLLGGDDDSTECCSTCSTCGFNPNDSEYEYMDDDLGETINQKLQDYTSTIPITISEETDYIIKLTENIVTLVRLLSKAQDAEDYALAIAVFAQCRADKSLSSILLDQWNNIMSYTLQDDSPNKLKILRSIVDKYDLVKKAPIFTKLYRFLMYCIGTSLFDKMGIKFDHKRFLKVEKAAIEKEYHMGPDFIHCLLDTILYLCETGQQCMITGSIDPIIHHESSYDQWIKDSELLRVQAKYITNPEPHGFTVFDFLSRLDSAVDKGKTIVKFISKTDNSSLIIRRLLSDLENIRADCKTKRLAQQERKAPFAVLVHGGSSVAKSQFTKLLFYHYGKLFNLPIDDEYKYTRNAFDQYWTNFNSSQWCLQLDDIAYLHPNSSQGCDPSLTEMLQVVNNVPYVPTQADLADKGKTPVRARFVIATTNTENLNAETYFACPLAVQRRLPFIINIVPRNEYKLNDGPMIDPAKIPVSETGDYPDLWRITVKRVVPRDAGRTNLHMGQVADYQTIGIFENVFDFLQWFSTVARRAEATQDKAMKCDADMKSVKLCEHDIPIRKCSACNTQLNLQSDEITIYDSSEPERTPWVNRVLEGLLEEDDEDPGYKYTMESILRHISFMSIINRIIVLWYMTVLWFMNTYRFGPAIIAFFYGRWYFFWIAVRLLHIPEMRYICCHLIGYKAYRAVRSPKVVLFCSAVAAAVTLLKVSRYLIDVRKAFSVKDDEHNFECKGCELCNDLTPEEVRDQANKIGQKCNANLSDQCGRCNSALQGAAAERGQSPEPKGDKQENVWYKDQFECTPFDVTPSSQSKTNWTLDETVKYISANCVSYKIRARSDDKIFEKMGRGFCIGGHTYVFNNHCIRFEAFEMDIKFQSSKDGITQNFTTLVTPIQLKRFPERDLVFVHLPSIPPKKDLRELFAKKSFEGRFDGMYVSRTQEGELVTLGFKAPKLIRDFRFDDAEKDAFICTDAWEGKTDIPTKDGECGSLLLVKSSMGPLILGIHALGGCVTRSTAFSVDYELIQSLNVEIFSDSAPHLQVGDYKQVVTDLSKKATSRYIQEGTMQVFGSFTGFRPSFKSRVTKTLMSDIAVRDGYERNTGAPILNTYVPWRKAMLDMSRPVSHIDLTLLNHCVESFTCDILAGLSPEDLSEVIVYDLNTAINGKPGLSYVDKMPRNTSAGFPFRKSKKYFLEAIAPFDEYQHPVKVTKEIEDEMDYIIVQYENSKVYCPIFTGSLKDEATLLRKIAAGKIRVFCGAPLPWSLVVRMYLLSTIRLIQKNRFLFESGPGTIAQSIEWHEIYSHITQFGLSRIVAGDYGKFDKRMPASVILAAFQIIKNILIAAGWSIKDLRVISGIAEDTAFPTIDFHGELIRCYGTNPSGHPLTVIINGLANSLYVRYCYATNHPQRTCSDFKEHIALMTYGDDMIMGVSEQCTWLDHTKMQATLANIDIEFTMADKEAESVPFIHIDQATFLRRSWRYENELECMVCPIEHASIDKMLTMCVESKTIGKELHAVAVLDTATREYFWFGKEIFLRKRALFYSWIDELNIRDYMDRDLPTWDQLISEFKFNSQLRK